MSKSLTLEEIKAHMLAKVMTPEKLKQKRRESALKGWEKHKANDSRNDNK